MDLVDDDSENDSDYEPGAEGEEEEADNNEAEKSITDISFSRKRKANALWDELQQEDKTTLEKALTKAIRAPKPESALKRSKASQQILASIFGNSVAKSITNKAVALESTDAKDIKKRLQESVESIQRKTTVTETRKFAGESISVVKSVSSSRPKPQVKPVKKTTAIDGVLEALKGPKVVSTISKSAIDWDNYKEKEGLEDDLAAAAKEGYLARKDFLDRCDVRAFEQERDDRVKSRKNP